MSVKVKYNTLDKTIVLTKTGPRSTFVHCDINGKFAGIIPMSDIVDLFEKYNPRTTEVRHEQSFKK